MLTEYHFCIDSGVGPLIWSLLEIDLAIICSCGPTLKPLFSRHRHGSKASTTLNQSASANSSSGNRTTFLSIFSRFKSSQNKSSVNSWSGRPRYTGYNRNTTEEEEVPLGNMGAQELNPLARHPPPQREWYDRNSLAESCAVSDAPSAKLPTRPGLNSSPNASVLFRDKTDSQR